MDWSPILNAVPTLIFAVAAWLYARARLANIEATAKEEAVKVSDKVVEAAQTVKADLAEHKEQVDEQLSTIHSLINSKTDALIKTVGDARFAEGKESERLNPSP
jgi:hypothetical protein